MAVTGGLNIIRRALSYGYDTGYGVDVTDYTGARYYQGKPVVNLHALGTGNVYTGVGTVGTTATVVNMETPFGNQAWKITIPAAGVNGYSNCRATGNTTVINRDGTPYFHGAYVWMNESTYDLWEQSSNYVYKYSTGSNGWSQWSYKSGFDKKDSTGRIWKLWGAANSNSSGGTANEYHTFFKNGTLATDLVFYVAAPMMLENESNPAPFINGTRSAFQSIYDLSDRSALNAGTVSYNSTGQPVFDGTDDYIGATGTQYTTGQPWTADMIINPTDITDGYWNAIFGGGLGNGGYFMFHGNGSLTYYEGVIAGSTKIKYFGKYLGSAFPQDTYTHLTVRYNGNSTYDIFINNDKSNHSYTFGSIYSMRLDSVGGAGGRYGSVQIPVFKFYEAALTDQEIEQNYLSYKNRFNL